MDQFKADAVRMKYNSTGETAVMDKAIESNVLSVDQYAEQLMDDLFLGIEHSLETGEVIEEEVVPAVTPIPIKPFVSTEPAPLSVVVPTEPALPEATAQPPQAPAAEANTAKPDWSLRILWAAAILSGAGALAICISNWSSYKALFQQLTGQTSTAEVLASVSTNPDAEPPSQEFAQYIQQSLEALASQQPAASDASLNANFAPQPAALPTPPATPSLPGGTASTTATATVPPGTILERVYIPVYQTPQGLVPVVPGVPVPNLTTGGMVLPGSTAVVPAPTAVPPTTVVSPGAVAAAPQAQTGQQQQPTAPVIPSGDTTAVQPLATSEHTLVGLLELGNSSAALFEVSGVTRRFSLGERIGSSGWTLVEVANSEAIVRRNGEIRSIFVGQTF